MGKITEIRPQQKDKNRCSIYLDGAFCCGLSLETAVKYRLAVGGEVTPEALAEMQAESERQTALDRALEHLSASMKTASDMEAFLKRKGYLPRVIDFVMEKLKAYGFVDDAEYARRYAASAGKTKGRRLVAWELRRKGVDEAEIDAALLSPEADAETAKAVFEKYMRGKPREKQTLQKAFRYLLSKGFDADAARAALGAVDEDSEI